MKNKPPGLSEEEETLWAKTMRGVMPLRPQREKKPRIAPTPAKESPPPNTQKTCTSKPADADARPVPALERSIAKRLRRGSMEIDATLDLHGYTLAEAHARLNRFIPHAQGQGKRAVLVITGKGKGGAHGALRADVPRWFAEMPLRRYILACEPAAPKHGGTGAYYVALKRKKPTHEAR